MYFSKKSIIELIVKRAEMTQLNKFAQQPVNTNPSPGVVKPTVDFLQQHPETVAAVGRKANEALISPAGRAFYDQQNKPVQMGLDAANFASRLAMNAPGWAARSKSIKDYQKLHPKNSFAERGVRILGGTSKPNIPVAGHRAYTDVVDSGVDFGRKHFSEVNIPQIIKDAPGYITNQVGKIPQEKLKEINDKFPGITDQILDSRFVNKIKDDVTDVAKNVATNTLEHPYLQRQALGLGLQGAGRGIAATGLANTGKVVGAAGKGLGALALPVQIGLESRNMGEYPGGPQAYVDNIKKINEVNTPAEYVDAALTNAANPMTTAYMWGQTLKDPEFYRGLKETGKQIWRNFADPLNNQQFNPFSGNTYRRTYPGY